MGALRLSARAIGARLRSRFLSEASLRPALRQEVVKRHAQGIQGPRYKVVLGVDFRTNSTFALEVKRPSPFLKNSREECYCGLQSARS
jgi:hypothetical protein